MILHYDKFIDHTKFYIKKIYTVSQICNCMNVFYNCTVLDLKSTPTVMLYYFKNSPWMYLWMSDVLPTPVFLLTNSTWFANDDNFEADTF